MFSRIALVLILLVAAPYYWFLIDTGQTNVPAQAIDIARLRAAAATHSGARPIGIEYAVVATETRIGTVLVAGGGLKADETAILVWRLVTPGGDTVINAGVTEDQAFASGFSRYMPQQQATAEKWLRTASRILFTSEEIDNIGGVITIMPQARNIFAKVVGNPVQTDAIRQLQPAAAKTLALPVSALSDPRSYAGIAPGIAVLRTPGHLPGAQMVYVQLQDGREFLFAGETAPMRRNVDWERPRSRYAAEWLGSEDRTATTSWIKGLAQLQARETGLTLVFANDLAWLQTPENARILAPAANTITPASQAEPAR